MSFVRMFFLAFFVFCHGSAWAFDLNRYTWELMGSKPSPDVNKNGIGIYVYDGINVLDAIGPYKVFKTAGLKTFLIAQKKGSVTTNDGLSIAVDKSIDEVAALDILLIPGGALETAMETKNTATLDWIKRIDQTTVYTTSVCTGAWILGATGLLQGKSATTNWYRADQMLAKYGAEFKQARWVQDGKYWTAAGVTAGIDMSLAIVAQLFGNTQFKNDFTQAVMLDLEYNPHPPIRGGSVQTTRPRVNQAMQYMYDMFLLPFVEAP